MEYNRIMRTARQTYGSLSVKNVRSRPPIMMRDLILEKSMRWPQHKVSVTVQILCLRTHP